MKILLLLIAVMISSCSNTKKDSMEKGNNAGKPELTKIEITGIAYNRKGGAVVDSKSIHYWINGRDFWEDKFLNKKVSVKGLLDIREDNPVFIDNSEIKQQGIPVANEAELQKQKKRFWIVKAEVKLDE